MNINKSQNGNELLVTVEGRIDTVTAPQFEQELMASQLEHLLDHSKQDRRDVHRSGAHRVCGLQFPESGVYLLVRTSCADAGFADSAKQRWHRHHSCQFTRQRDFWSDRPGQSFPYQLSRSLPAARHVVWS